MGAGLAGFTSALGNAAMTHAQKVRDDQEKQKDMQAKARWDTYTAAVQSGRLTPEQAEAARQQAVADVSKIYGNSKPLKEIFQKFSNILEAVHTKAKGGTPAAAATAPNATGASATPTAPTTAPATGLPAPPATSTGSAPATASPGIPAPPQGGPAAPPATMPPPPASSADPRAAELSAAFPSPMARAQEAAGVQDFQLGHTLETKKKLAIEGGLTPNTPEYNEYVYGIKPVSTVPHAIGHRISGSDITRSYPGITDPAGNAPAPDQNYDVMLGTDGQVFASPSGTASTAQPKLLAAAGGGAPYGVERNGKMLLPGMKDWTADDQAVLDAGLKSYAQGDERALHRLEVAANARARAYASTRMYGAIDKDTGELTFVTPQQVSAQPDKYGPASQSVQAMQRGALFDEIGATSAYVNSAIDALGDDSFTAVQRAKLALVLRSPNPESAKSEFLNSTAATGLSDAQINYVTSLVSLEESAMSLRSLGGMGQGSDQLRSAITAMLPGPGTPSKAYAKRQMQLFQVEVDQLRKSLPGVGATVPRQSGGSGPFAPQKPKNKLPAPPTKLSPAAADYLKQLGPGGA